MPAAPLPENETDRLADLRNYRILNTPAEDSYDHLTQLAAYLCQTPVALISLVDEHRQWFKSICGLTIFETSRKQAFCGYTILDNVPLIIEDATTDSRVSDNLLVQSEPKIRFYAGIPLTSPQGYNLGSLCVIDFVPKRLHPKQIDGLKTLAFQVVHLLEAKLFSEKVAHYTQALEKAHAEALQANQAKSQFLAMVSHDIRTPLYGIVGTLDLLADSSLSAQQQQYVATANTSAQMLHSIISDVLDFSKIEANKLLLTPVPTSLTTLCMAIEEVLKDEIAQKRLQFLIDIEPAIPEMLLIDQSRLSQVLLNLCSNAVKFTPIKGSITLSCCLQQLNSDTATIRISVADTGIGIATDQQQQVFSPFVQANNNTYQEYGGTGLGLAISSRLLGLMRSRLHLQSALGEGSIFYFTLDCPRAEMAPAKVQPQYPLQDALPRLDHSLRILVAEDNRINQKLLQHLLEKNGCTVSLASDGKAACQQFLAQSFDLVIMDLEMPIMNGEEAAQEIFSHCQRRQKQVPIIILTAHAVTETQERLLGKGVHGYLTKPIRAESLFRAIAAAVT